MLPNTAPFFHAQAVTPHATNPVKTDGQPVRRIQVGGTGTVVCRFVGDGADATFTVPAGGIIDGLITHVRATSTGTLMVAQW